MIASLKANLWRIGVAVAVVAGLASGLYVTRFPTTEAFPAMPAEQQDYWAWVTTINRGSEAALEAGIALLEEHPQIERLYLRLADLCLEKGEHQACTEAFGDVFPPTPVAALYREAARARLVEGDSTLAARPLWEFLASSVHLDPGIARLIVDAARSDATSDWTADLEQLWNSTLASDSSRAGTAFGLGYLAVLRGDWDRGERLLTHTTRLLPNDPEAYRELGRIYYTTGRPDDFESALTRGIDAAKFQHDVEKELILRGNLGLGVLNQGNLEAADAAFTAALEQSRTLSDGETEGFNLFRLSGVRAGQHKYDESLRLLDEAINLYRDNVPSRVSEAYVRKASVLRGLFRYGDAESLLEKALDNARDFRNIDAELSAGIELGHVRLDMGRTEAAAEIAQDMLRRAAASDYALNELMAWVLLGDIAHLEGEFDLARQYFGEAIRLADRSKNYHAKRSILDRLGHAALNVQDANSANSYFDEMLGLAEQIEDSTALATVYRGLGRTYRQFGNYRESLRYHDLALEYVIDELPVLRSFILMGKAWTYMYMQNVDSALVTLDLAKVGALEDETATYNFHLSLGHALLYKGDFADALRELDLALDIEAQVPWALNWHVHYAKALSHWRNGDEREAERSFKVAVRAVELTRAQLESSDSRATYVNNKAQVFKDFATFLEENGRTAEALAYTERARSRTLVDLLYTTQLQRERSTGNPVAAAIDIAQRITALAEEERDLREEAALLASASETARLTRLRTERKGLETTQSQLRLSEDNRLYTYDPVSLDAAQDALESGEAMVMYDLRTRWTSSGEEDASVAYIIAQHSIDAVRLDIDSEDLFDSIRFFRDHVSSSDKGPGSNWEPVARRLYSQLMAPVIEKLPAKIRHLHIVPEGVLHYLPFAALLNGDRFLIEDFTLSTVPSATILKLCRETNPRSWDSILMFADPDGTLPGSRREVHEIAALDPSRHHAYVGEAAKIDVLSGEAARFDILHLATHGRFVRRAPWKSHLEMSGDPLSLSRIAELDLRDSYLVTLSACETALSSGAISDIPNGEEWVGLYQSFLAAGAPTVLASLWSIDDQVSSQLMIEFYRQLESKGKADALALVQRRFLKYPDTRHPFYWAAFTIIGDPL